MADTTTQPQPPAPGSEEWLDKKTAEPEVPATETPKVAEVTTQPTTTEEPWWTQGFADANHGFLKNRKGPEVEQAFRATEAEMRKSWNARTEAEARAIRAEARAAAMELAIQMAKEEKQPKEDPSNEGERIFFEQGPAAAFKWFAGQNDAKIAAEADRIASQKLQQFQQANSDQARMGEQARRLKTALDVANTVRASLGVDQHAWDNERGLAVSARIINTKGLDGLTEGQNWTDAYKALYPDAQQPAPVVATPTPTNPPGSHRAAPPSEKPNAGLPTMAGEQEEAYKQLASEVGIDPEKFLKRIKSHERRANA